MLFQVAVKYCKRRPKGVFLNQVLHIMTHTLYLEILASAVIGKYKITLAFTVNMLN